MLGCAFVPTSALNAMLLKGLEHVTTHVLKTYCQIILTYSCSDCFNEFECGGFYIEWALRSKNNVIATFALTGVKQSQLAGLQVYKR